MTHIHTEDSGGVATGMIAGILVAVLAVVLVAVLLFGGVPWGSSENSDAPDVPVPAGPNGPTSMQWDAPTWELLTTPAAA